MGKYGAMIAKAVPPPGKLGKGGLAAADDPGADDTGGASDQDEDAAAELSAADELQKAFKSGSASDVLEAFKNLSDICSKGY
jgi:hypothetical protein